MNRALPLFLCLVFLTACAPAEDYKNADLAGSWYSSNPLLLRRELNSFLDKADPPLLKGDVIALITPHAGFMYSGQTAAYGFKALEDKAIKTVIVVGFSHRLAYDGIAVFEAEGIKTPLGVLETDRELKKALLSCSEKIFTKPDAFKGENSVELILPFIQASWHNPKVVLLALGQQSFENCQILGDALYETLKDKDDFVIIASTDMSHYLSQSIAQSTDAGTEALIKEMDSQKIHRHCYSQNRMCGTGAVVATMIAAKRLGATTTVVLDVSTSAEASGDSRKVVGYLSVALVKESDVKEKKEEAMEELLTKKQKEDLLALARKTISLYLSEGKTLKETSSDPVLNESMGLFVTLHKNKQLRGCIGNIIGRKPLYQGVIDMAIAASTQDPRFGAVTKDEFEDIHLEISVLSPLKQITDTDEITLGTHGVLVKDFLRSGVYLPQVATETGWTKEEFMNSLCAQKAGMAPDAWKTGKCEMYIFSAEVFSEPE